jgi:glutamine amidotransferase
MLGIVDYGMGNIRSVCNAVEHLGFECRVLSTPESLTESDRIVLPGVGSFRDAMDRLRSGGWKHALDEAVLGRKVPVLGICLGMQLFFSVGDEDGPSEGLGWIPGRVRRIEPPAGTKIPHVGFNALRILDGSGIMAGIEDGSCFYFVHSFHAVPDDPAVVTSTVRHGCEFASSVRRGNIQGTQFHPEKSQGNGLRLLFSFLDAGAT